MAAARAGAGWLARLIDSSGGYVPTDATKPTSAPDGVATANALLALHAAGVARREAADALHWLEGNYPGFVRAGGADAPGALATVILAASASGVDPGRFGGTGRAHDLVARLLATRRAAGKDAGLFGSQDPTYDGAFRQGLALLALAAVGRSDPAATRWLSAQQCTNGGWTAYRPDVAVPCPAPDPAAFSGPDTNSTALALQGLLAQGVHPARPALDFLAGAQGADGGFAYIGGRAQHSDPNSTAVAIQAVLAAGGDPAGATWVRNGRSPYDALLAFQLNCPDAGRGAFWFDTGDGTRTPNVLATVQAVPAAAGAVLPLPATRLAGEVPLLPCPGTPSPTPSGSSPPPSPAASGTPTAEPTGAVLPTDTFSPGDAGGGDLGGGSDLGSGSGDGTGDGTGDLAGTGLLTPGGVGGLIGLALVLTVAGGALVTVARRTRRQRP